MINLPLHSASTIVHHYRRSIVSRYNLTFDDEDEEQRMVSSISAKWSEENDHIQKNTTGHRDSSITQGN